MRPPQLRRCHGRTGQNFEFSHLHDVTTMIELLACLGVDVTLNEFMVVETLRAGLKLSRL